MTYELTKEELKYIKALLGKYCQAGDKVYFDLECQDFSMKKLDGFQLKLFCNIDDFYRTNYISRAELEALFQPFSINDSELPKYYAYCDKVSGPTLSIFITLSQATDPKVWEAIIGWMKGHGGRTMRLRCQNIGGDIVTIEEIQPLLERTLKELTSLSSNLTDPERT